MQSVPIIINVVSSNLAQATWPPYNIKFISDLWQFCWFFPCTL